MLSIASWLLDDLGGTEIPPRDAVEGHLFLASLLLAVRTHVSRAIADPSSFSDEASAALGRFCTERAMRDLMLAVPPDSPFWEIHAAISLEDVEAGLSERAERSSHTSGSDPAVFLRGLWSAPGKIVGMAAAGVVDRLDVGVPLQAMLDDLGAAIQVEAELASMYEDLLVGRITYPIAHVAVAAGMPLQSMPPAERILGALVVTRSIPAILAAAVERVVTARTIAAELRLVTFEGFLDEVAARLERRIRTVRSGGDGARTSVTLAPAMPLMRLAEPSIPRALAMARAFLLADPILRESWETHREGMLGSDEVASRYPAGLILAWLCEDGLDLPDRVDGFLAFTVANQFRYYDHPWSGVDADTIGICLRLLRHAGDRDRHRQAIYAVLGCLDRQVGRQGAIPVWVTDCDPPGEAPPDIVALGEGCATVAAHLLVGLLESAVAGQGETLDVGGADLLGRIRSLGLAANVNYPPIYAIGVFSRLLAILDRTDLRPDIEAALQAARPVLGAELDRVLRLVPATPQEAALLTLACREAGSLDRLHPRWLSMVLKGQRSDGGWPAEPFAPAPNRGGWVSWYSSSALTTALCHGALLAHDRALATGAAG